jgi:hypothetical protein
MPRARNCNVSESPNRKKLSGAGMTVLTTTAPLSRYGRAARVILA